MKRLTLIQASLVMIGLVTLGSAQVMAARPGDGATGGGCKNCMRGNEMRHGEMHAGARGQGMRGGGMHGNRADMQQIHTLLANHAAVQRSVKKLPDGVETVTTSRDPRVAALLPQHVEAMYTRMKQGRLIRGFDPLFVELFRQADKIDVRVEKLKDGVRVVETSRDPYAVKLIQAHADAVDGFVKEGMAAMHRVHPLPNQEATERRQPSR